MTRDPQVGMDARDRESIIAICLLAARADGQSHPPEEDQLARILTRLGAQDLARVGAAVERGELTAAQAASRLSSDEARQLAYELAVTMVYADGDANPGERAFLDELGPLLRPESRAAAMQDEARSLAVAPVQGPLPSGSPWEGEAPRPSQAGLPAMSHDTALDLLIRQQALLAGALELLPQRLASLAIIPIQMRLVHRIGADYGQRLDGDRVKDLLGAMGIGAAAQLLDRTARRMLGLGGLVGGLAGAGLAFVTTYALGHAAKQYYAQGRRLSRDDLRELFERFREDATALLPKVQEEIRAQADHLDLGRLLATVRGQPVP